MKKSKFTMNDENDENLRREAANFSENDFLEAIDTATVLHVNRLS